MTIYDEYVKLEQAIAKLEGKKVELREQIKADIKDKTAPVVLAGGTFVRTIIKTYKYTAAIDQLQEKVDAQIQPLKEKITALLNTVKNEKKIQEDAGIAEKVESVNFQFKVAKEKTL